jgi:hypothetical protein
MKRFKDSSCFCLPYLTSDSSCNVSFFSCPQAAATRLNISSRSFEKDFMSDFLNVLEKYSSTGKDFLCSKYFERKTGCLSFSSLRIIKLMRSCSAGLDLHSLQPYIQKLLLHLRSKFQFRSA